MKVPVLREGDTAYGWWEKRDGRWTWVWWGVIETRRERRELRCGRKGWRVTCDVWDVSDVWIDVRSWEADR